MGSLGFIYLLFLIALYVMVVKEVRGVMLLVEWY